MKANLLEGTMCAEHKTKLGDSIKEAFEFVVNKPDQMFEKVKYHMVVVTQMLMLSNAPCSHRHFTAIIEIIERLLQADVKNEMRPYCLEQFGIIKEFPTNLVQDSLNNARL